MALALPEQSLTPPISGVMLAVVVGLFVRGVVVVVVVVVVVHVVVVVVVVVVVEVEVEVGGVEWVD